MKIQEHNFWKSVNAKDLYQQPAKHLKVFLKFQLVTASHLWRVCVFATNQWELSKLRKATCWDWCQVGAKLVPTNADRGDQSWRLLLDWLLTRNGEWTGTGHATEFSTFQDMGCQMPTMPTIQTLLDFETPLAIYASFANPCDELAIGFPNQSDNE